MAATWIRQIDVGGCRFIAAQHLRQATRDHVWPDDEIRLERDPRARHGESGQKPPAIGVKRAADLHGEFAALRIAERPRMTNGQILVSQTCVPREILRALRLAVSL